MQSAVGRPGPSHASSSRAAPYPQPGVARPPQPRAPAQIAAGGLSVRATARLKWARIFAGPPFLELGPTNRLVLSVRSGVPAEVDFGLERLVQVSSVDADLLRLSELPGLLDGLLALIREYLDRRKADRASGIPSLGATVGQEPREAVRRRAAEAALVLRNLAPFKGSAEVVLGSKRLKKLICEVLEDGQGEATEAEETTELRLYLLEVLEGIADKIPLALPGHAIAPDAHQGEEDDSRPPPQPEPLDSPAVRLFPLLVALTRSNDRALILASFRVLTVLSTNNKSDSVFALLTYDSIPPLPKPHPHPVQTAIELLPLADADLTTAALDFIYQHTTLPSNAVLLSARPELLGILKLLCSKFHVKGKLEEVSIDLRVAAGDGKKFYDSLPKKHAKRVPDDAAGGTDEPMSKEELQSILYMPEPARCLAWMRLVYEPSPSSDVPQVVFWKSYEFLFQRYMAPNVPPMLAAADVIKHASDGHPSATPVVLEQPERKFVIRGIRQRDRPDLRSEHRCRWTGCTSNALLTSSLATYQHCLSTHLHSSDPSSTPSSCSWNSCTYTSTLPDPSLRLADHSLHLRTHLPPLSSSTAKLPSPNDLSDLPAILAHERHHSERDPSTGNDLTAAGASLLAVLTLRNVARTAKLALEAKLAASGPASSTATNGASSAGGVSVASGNAAIGRLAGDEQSIFEAFAAAAEGLAQKDGVLSRLEKVDHSLALPAVEALLSVQETLVKIVMSDVALGKVLGEVVQVVEWLRRETKKSERRKEEREREALEGKKGDVVMREA
ncbi:hypothetical protein JCM8547_000339 [Rhodosporidiobolus lusitaniae]